MLRGKGSSLLAILLPQLFKQPGRLFCSDFISVFPFQLTKLVQLRIRFTLATGGRARWGAAGAASLHRPNQDVLPKPPSPRPQANPEGVVPGVLEPAPYNGLHTSRLCT